MVGLETVSPSSKLLGASSTDNTVNGGDPPDGAIAAGPSHLIEAVNSSVLVLSKAGGFLAESPLANFFPVPSTSFTTDPRVLYDTTTGRWFVLTLSQASDRTNSRLHVAYSQNADPLGAYCKYTFDMTLVGGLQQAIYGDFPGLGVNNDGFFVTVSRLFINSPTGYDVKVLQMPRSMFNGCPISVTATGWNVVNDDFPDGVPVQLMQPATTFGTGPEYFAASELRGGSYIAVYSIAISGTQLLGPTFVPVPSYAAMPRAVQQGSAAQLYVGDNRIPSAPVSRGGSLWLAHGAASPAGTPAVVWYQINPTNDGLVARQLLWFDGGGYFEPSLMVDSAGNLAINMGYAGTSFYPGTAFATRNATDPTTTPPNVLIYATGLAPHSSLTGSFVARWGDYHGIALDPDGQRIWIEGEYSPAPGTNWKTVIAQITAASPSTETGRYLVTAVTTTPYAGSTVTISAQLVNSSGAPLAVAGRVVTWSASPPGVFVPMTTTTSTTGVATVQFTTAATPTSYTITAVDNLGASGISAPFTTVQRPPPTATVYLPNITKTLGGPNGWATPFIVQNIGTVPTTLEATFYRFADGALIAQRTIPSLAPGTSYADVPNNDADLPDNTQFSVVLRSWGANIVSTVNEAQGAGPSFESMSYTGVSSGTTTAYLPNVTRNFYGWDIPFIVQNLGLVPASVTAKFTSLSSPSCTVAHTYTRALSIASGRSGVVDPNAEPAYSGFAGSGLIDGCQYSVVVTSTQPVAVVANARNETGAPVAYAHNALAAGATTLYAPYAALGAAGGRFSPIVVQNVGITASSATLEFTPLGGGTVRSFTLTAIAPGASRAFDPRYSNGDTTQPLCAATSASCLASGEYSLRITSPTPVAAVVLPNTGTTASAYSAGLVGSQKSFMPNVTRTLGGAAGWTTPIVIQSISATNVTFKWYRFSDGVLVTTQNVAITPLASKWIDPRTVSGLSDNTQYAVVADGGVGASITTIVYEQNFAGGDGDMIYEGFASP